MQVLPGTMERNKYLANRLREVYLSGTWIANTNYMHQLQQTDWQLALRKLGDHNSIAALTFHINYYLEGILAVTRGEPLSIRDIYSFDMPELQSEVDWQQRIATLQHNAETLAAKIDAMTDAELDAPFVKEQYGTWYRNLEGLIEHGYYHLGQIALIRKLLVAL